jgi:DNA-binding NarL/FixJ family response regulator
MLNARPADGACIGLKKHDELETDNNASRIQQEKNKARKRGNRLGQEVAMSITAIPSLIAVAPAGESSAANAPAAPPPQPAAKVPTDTIQLTEADRVYQLYNQGQQVPQIANTLSLREAAVNSYLNISNNNAA